MLWFILISCLGVCAGLCVAVWDEVISIKDEIPWRAWIKNPNSWKKSNSKNNIDPWSTYSLQLLPIQKSGVSLNSFIVEAERENDIRTFILRNTPISFYPHAKSTPISNLFLFQVFKTSVSLLCLIANCFYLAVTKNAGDRVYASYNVYKGKAGVSMMPCLPTFTKLDVYKDSCFFYLCLFLSNR